MVNHPLHYHSHQQEAESSAVADKSTVVPAVVLVHSEGIEIHLHALLFYSIE